jgi:hypothetical protein
MMLPFPLYRTYDAILTAAENGDLATLSEQLSTFFAAIPSPPRPTHLENFLSELPGQCIDAAAESGHARCVDWLINMEFPVFHPDEGNLLKALSGGVEICRLFLQKWPWLARWSVGEGSNCIGWAVVASDKGLVELLLESGVIRVDPNEAEAGGERVSLICAR